MHLEKLINVPWFWKVKITILCNIFEKFHFWFLQGPGEQCGGMFDLAGKCIEGYRCQPHPKYTQLPGVCVKDSRK